MKKNLNNADLRHRGVHDKYILFYQAWKELTDFRTLDSYQYRIMNTLSSIRELVEVIDGKLNGYYKTNHNTDECKAEAFEIIRNDRVLKKYYPIDANNLMFHLAEKMDSDMKLKALRYHLDYIYERVNKKYLENLFSLLEEDLEAGESYNIVDDANRLISNCISSGWSSYALYDCADILNDSLFEDRWSVFKNRILSDSYEEYHVVIPFRYRTTALNRYFKIDKTLQEIFTKDFEICSLDIVGNRYPYVSFGKSKEYVDIKVYAYDYFNASHLALSKYANVLNLLSFYNVIEAWSIKDISWNSINVRAGTSKTLSPKEIYATYEYVGAAASQVREAIKTVKDGRMADRIYASYFYSNMGKASYAIEEKYMNIWVALESLCRSDVSENIIRNILDSVPAALCNGYIYNKIRNYIEDCERCNVELEFDGQPYNYKNPDKQKLVRNMLTILKNDSLYEDLKRKCAVNSLLVMRTIDMHKMISDEEVLIQVIEKHYLNVRRHLSRLYRIRNAIAHTAAVEDVAIVRYVEHLEDYLTIFMSEIVRYARKENCDNIEIVMEMIKDNYVQFSSNVHAKKDTGLRQMVIDNILNTGFINLI